MELENDILKGNDKYPKMMMAVYKLLVNWKQEPRNMMGSGSGDGLAFTTNAGEEEYDWEYNDASTGTTLATQGKKEEKGNGGAGGFRRLTDTSNGRHRYNCQQKRHYTNDWMNERWWRCQGEGDKCWSTDAYGSRRGRQF